MRHFIKINIKPELAQKYGFRKKVHRRAGAGKPIIVTGNDPPEKIIYRKYTKSLVTILLKQVLNYPITGYGSSSTAIITR